MGDPLPATQRPQERSTVSFIHVDEWIDSPCLPSKPEAYAKWFLMLKRLPAWMQSTFHPQIEKYRLYCTYRGETYRVTGASRLGDIWLRSDLSLDTGYDPWGRVNLAECSNWRSEP